MEIQIKEKLKRKLNEKKFELNGTLFNPTYMSDYN